VPQEIRTAPARNLGVAQVQQSPAISIGQSVRWGGTIVATQNLADATEIEVLSRPLDHEGEPRLGSRGEGRFIARFAGFLDPAEYAKDRELTVVGAILRIDTRKVGSYPYPYPVVAAQSRYLWPQREQVLLYPYPDPWYGPGWGPWPGAWGPWPYAPGFRPWWGPW
jgi:outer membrane lipoprotein